MGRARWIAPAVVAGVAAFASVAAPAQANGVTREQLQEHGWTCVEFLPANRWSCFNPGQGRPSPGDPEAPPSYTFLGFDRTTGEFLYTGHLIRGDLYAGQPCAPGSDPYVYRAAVNYYECVHS